MTLQEYIERSRILELKIVPEAHREELLGQLEGGIQLPELVEEYRHLVEDLPRQQLKRLFEARAEWRERERAIERLRKTVDDSGLKQPPESVLERALVPHKVDALARAIRICDGEGLDDEAWETALSGLLDVWSGAVVQTLRRGTLKVNLKADHPDVMQFEEFARRTEVVSDLPTTRWQAIRRGLRAGALTVSFDPPLSSIRGHLDGIRPRLGPTASERDADGLVEEMVTSVLTGTLQGQLDRRAEGEAIRHATAQYQKLLTGAPLAAGRIGAISLSGNGGTAGVIVVAEGDLPELQESVAITDETVTVPGDEGEDSTERAAWIAQIDTLFEVSGIEQIAVPASAPGSAGEALTALRSALDDSYELMAVRPSALAEARQLLVEPPLSLPAEIASALVLARRALQPSDEWERVDPVAIGLADYQNDLNEERLREALLETLGAFQLDRATGAFVPPPPKPSARAASPAGRLNPMVKHITDLKAGMMLDGVITNITRFGAFVNIGLAEEGMIHISELSTEFVQTPSDVVSIGERVNARVLDVEPHKRRIALSLKPPPAEREHSGPPRETRGGGTDGKNVPLDTRIRRDNNRAGGGFGRRGGRERSVGRSQALNELENLFKKDD